MKNLLTLLISLFVIYTATAGAIKGTKKFYIYSSKKIEKIINKNLHSNF